MGDVDTTSASGSSIDRPTPGSVPRVVWTRGPQCQVLADVLSGDAAIRAGSDVGTSCIEARATLLVTRHLTSLEICNVAVPHGFSPAETRSIVAAVGGGPHSRLAVTVAHTLGHRLGVPVRAVYGHHGADERTRALEVLDELTGDLPDVDREAVQAPSPAAMVGGLPEGTLLVVGAPGGSWFQRQFFGPGARILAKAPGGTIVVRSAPPRVYQVMQPATAFGPHMRVADALQLADTRHLIVAERGKLLGLISHTALVEADRDLELQDIMESPAFLAPDEDVDHAAELVNDHQGSAIPVVNSRHRIVGTVAAHDLEVTPPL
jgi:CBS domain-containing protein